MKEGDEGSMLRMRAEWRQRRHASETCDEIAPSHVPAVQEVAS